MIHAVLGEYNVIRVFGLWQYDYGQLVELAGVEIPDGTNIHFAQGGKTIEGTIRSNQVAIPDYFLQFPENINAYVYVETGSTGETTVQLILDMRKRDRPPDYIPPDEPSYTRLLPPGWEDGDYLTSRDGKLVWINLDGEYASDKELAEVAASIPQFATMSEIEDFLNKED